MIHYKGIHVKVLYVVDCGEDGRIDVLTVVFYDFSM